jgi:hypothetical protein
MITLVDKKLVWMKPSTTECPSAMLTRLSRKNKSTLKLLDVSLAVLLSSILTSVSVAVSVPLVVNLTPSISIEIILR